MAFQNGITGFVRIPDAIDPNKVYAIGPGGRPIADENDLMRATGASSIAQAWQLAQVKLMTPEEALKVAITDPNARRKGTTSTPAPTPVNNNQPTPQPTPTPAPSASNNGTQFSAYGVNIQNGVQPTLEGNRVFWRNPDGSYVWADLGNSLVSQYAPQYAQQNNSDVQYASDFVNNPSNNVELDVKHFGGVDNYLKNLFASQGGWSQARKDETTKLVKQKYGNLSSTSIPTSSSAPISAPAPVTANTSMPINAPDKVQIPDPLVRFSAEPTPQDTRNDMDTVWLYDRQDKTYRPVNSPQALAALTGKSVEDAFKLVNVLPTTVLDTSDWTGKFIQRTDAIKEDGKIPTTSNFVIGTGSTLSSQSIDNYGKQGSADADKLGVNFMGLLLTTAKNSGYISQSTFDKYAKDPNLLTRYSNAVTYGEYEPSYILKDIKAKELSDQGNAAYKNFKAFDENLPANQWRNTTEGQKVQSDSGLSIPPSLNISQDILNNPLFSIPAEAFKTLVSPIDWNSPEFKTEAEKIQASFYDIQMQKSEADTEQKKALADNNWKIFQENLKKKYGIDLSNNARQAWKQLDDMFTGYSSRGLAKSGVFNEAMDKYLGDVRRQDKLTREAKISEQDQQQRNYLLNSGSTKDINDFINGNGDPKLAEENRKKAQEWGLLPSSDMTTWLDKANLKKLYPDMSDAELDVIRGMFVDENGHYKSNLYQSLWSNKYELGEQKKTYQQQKLYEQKLNEENKAYQPYTSGNPFSSFYNKINTNNTPADVVTPPGSNPSSPTDTSSTPPANSSGTKPYMRNPNSPNVYDRQGNYISADQAAKIPGFWDQVELTPTAPNTPLNNPAATPSTSTTPKAYIRNPSSSNVYDRQGNYISADQAAKIPNFWDQVELTPSAPNTPLNNPSPTSSPTPTSNPTSSPAISPSGLDSIRKVFGSSWTPTSAFNNLKNQGIYGAVNVTDSPEPWKVYTLGESNGKYQPKWIESPEAYRNLFNTDKQEGIVGGITKAQAKALMLPGY